MKILLIHSGSLSRLPSGEQLVAELEQKWFEIKTTRPNFNTNYMFDIEMLMDRF